jgi:5-methylthioadenosine/S-adenosylhomocysteine deaminase
MAPLNNPAGAVIYNAHPGLVDTVLVAGRVVKRAGKLVGHDPARIVRLAEETRDYVLSQARSDSLISDVQLGGGWIPRNPAAVPA